MSTNDYSKFYEDVKNGKVPYEKLSDKGKSIVFEMDYKSGVVKRSDLTNEGVQTLGVEKDNKYSAMNEYYTKKQQEPRQTPTQPKTPDIWTPARDRVSANQNKAAGTSIPAVKPANTVTGMPNKADEYNIKAPTPKSTQPYVTGMENKKAAYDIDTDEIAQIVSGTAKKNFYQAKPTTNPRANFRPAVIDGKVEDNSPGVGEVISKSVLAGMNQANMSALNVPRMVHKGISKAWDTVTPDFLYKAENDPLTKVLDKGVEHFEKQANETRQSLGELKGIKNFLNTGLESLPTMFMAAFAGAGIGGGAAAGTLGKSAKLAPEIARMIPFGAIAAGGYARDAEKEGASYTQQVLYGTLSGIAEMATEAPVVEGVLDTVSKFGAGKLIEQGSKNFIGKYGKLGLAWLSSTLKEGLQETIIEPITGTIKKMTYGKDTPVYGEGGIIDPKQMGSAFYGGVAMSVVLGALGLPAYAASRKYVENRIETGKPLDSKSIEEAKKLMNQDIENLEATTKNIEEKPTDLNADTDVLNDTPMQKVTDDTNIQPEPKFEATEQTRTNVPDVVDDFVEATNNLDKIEREQEEIKPIPKYVQRIEEPNIPRATIDKPQGIYTSPSEVESPHKDLGGDTSYWETNPNANILQIKTSTFETNRGLVGESAGVGAARKLLGDNEVSRMMKLTKTELAKELKEKHPNVEWDRYYDQQELIETLAGVKAREKGYDAIWAVDIESPEFDEFVALTNNAVKDINEVPADMNNYAEEKQQDTVDKPAEITTKTESKYNAIDNSNLSDEDKAIIKDHYDKFTSAVEKSGKSINFVLNVAKKIEDEITNTLLKSHNIKPGEEAYIAGKTEIKKTGDITDIVITLLEDKNGTITQETIHEFAEVWCALWESSNPTEYNNVVKTLMDKGVSEDEAIEMLPELITDYSINKNLLEDGEYTSLIEKFVGKFVDWVNQIIKRISFYKGFVWGQLPKELQEQAKLFANSEWDKALGGINNLEDRAGYSVKVEKVTPWGDDFPKGIGHTTIAFLKSEKNGNAELHKKAKAGDEIAATQLVEKCIKKERILQLAKQYPDAIIIPAIAEERTGINMLPYSYAKTLSKVGGFEVNEEIYQINRTFHTGAKAMDRIISKPIFDGEIKEGYNYIIVDDVVTQGGTLNALRQYIEENGGNVVAVSALAFDKGSTEIAINKNVANHLVSKFGRDNFEQFLREEGIAWGIEELTNSEGLYFLKFRDVDSIRNRANEAKSQRSWKENRRILGGESSIESPEQGDFSITRYSIRVAPPPKKTITGYKLMRVKKTQQGKLFPLYVSADKETPTGVWLDAEEGEMKVDQKTGTKKVSSKLGLLAYRPGWHLGDIPLATHIGVKGNSGEIEYMNSEHVWCECEVAADVNYQSEANANGLNSKTGKINLQKADIKKLPTDGFYRYKTNPNMTGNWIISGAIKINRVLTDAEVSDILAKNGSKVMPRDGGTINLKDYGFDVESSQYSLKTTGDPILDRYQRVFGEKPKPAEIKPTKAKIPTEAKTEYPEDKIFDKTELVELNNKLLGDGAPTQYDNVGYNKIDYDFALSLSKQSDLTDNQLGALANLLAKYGRTQLGIDPTLLKNTSEHYKNKNVEAENEAEQPTDNTFSLDDLPELTGSPKQIKWANDIKINTLKMMKRFINENKENDNYDKYIKAYNIYKGLTKARDIIDTRQLSTQNILEGLESKGAKLDETQTENRTGQFTGLNYRISIEKGEAGKADKSGLFTTRGGKLKEGTNILGEKISENLRQHQIEGVNLAIKATDEYGGFILSDGTGAGKTRQEIAYAHYYLSKGKKVLIVTTNTTNISKSFKSEADAMGISLAEVEGGNIKDDIINITTYTSLKNANTAVDYIVFDESHNLKNRNSDKTKRGVDLASKATGVMFASATPFDKALQIKYLDKIGIFKRRSFSKIMSDLGYEYKEKNIRGRTVGQFERSVPIEDAESRLSSFFDELGDLGLITKREVPMNKVEIFYQNVKLGDAATNTLNMIYDYYANQFGSNGEGGIRGIGQALMLMAQRRFQESFKINDTMSIVKQELKEGRKVVIFATRINDTEMSAENYAYNEDTNRMEQSDKIKGEGTISKIGELLTNEGIKIAKIYGNGNVDKEVDKFQSGKADVAIVTPQKGGAGLSLDDTVGDGPRTMIVITPPFSGVDNVQMAGRINRLNTASNSKIIYLFADTDVDAWNKNIISEKMKTLNAVVKGDIEKLDTDKLTEKTETPAETKVKTPTLYRYYTTQRPPGPGAIPSKAKNVVSFDKKTYVPEIGREAWGYAEYYDFLVPMDVEGYELVEHPYNEELYKKDMDEWKNGLVTEKELILGNDSEVTTNDGENIAVQYAIVDANKLISSHDTALNPNKDYPLELQPRQRERQSSALQINKIMNSLNPALLGENPLASDGAPIIGKDLVVESGNGRTIALKKMYETDHENKQKYIDWLEENKANFGITGQLPDNPILVRIRDTDVDRVAFVKKANESSVAAMSYSEQAKSDAEKLTDATVLKFVQNDEGTINTAANKEFITAFVRDSVPQSEMPRVLTKDGMLSQEGLVRIKNALFYKAYEDISLIDVFSESLDNSIKNITNFMLNIAPKIIYIKSQIKADNLYDIDFAKDIAEATRLFKALKDKGQSVEEYLNQFSLFGDVNAEVAEILNILDKNNRSTKKLSTVFNYALDMVINAGNPNQVSMFDNISPSKGDILEHAIGRFNNEQSGQAEGQLTLFEVEPENSRETEPDSKRSRKETKGKGKSKGTKSSAITQSLTGEKPQIPQGDGSSNLDDTKTVDEIVEIIEKAIGVPIRTGKFRQKAHGIFKQLPEVIRVKVTNDLPTICHEVGHYLDKKFSLDDKQFKAELMSLGKPTSRASYTNEEVRAEGIAEFVRLYLTNPKEAQNKAPNFLQHFETKLDRDSLAMLNGIRTDILKVVNLSAGDRILNDMSIGEARKATKQETGILGMLQRAYNAWVDEYAPFSRVQKRAEQEGYKGKNIDITVQNYRGLEGKVLDNINMAQTDINGKVIGKSFNEILKPVKKNEVNDFRKYMVSRRAIDYEGRNMVMPEPYAVYHDTVISMEQKHSHFADVFDKLREWENNELQLLVNSGIMSQETVDEILVNNPNHVPLYRIQEAVEAVHGGSGSTLGQSKKVIKKAKGSGKTIIDPLESMIFNAFIIRRAAEANQILSMLGDMADGIEGFGDLVEAVPPGVKGFSFNIEEIEKKLKDIWETDTGQKLDTTGVDLDKLVTLFRANYRERNNEITVYRNGKPKLYQVESELYKAIKGLNREASHFIIRALNVPKRIIQAGAVTTLQFVMRNMARDTVTSLIQSEAGLNPWDIAKGYISAARKDKWYQQWVRSGAATEYLQINDRTQVQNILDDVVGYTLIDKLRDAIKKPTKENLTRLLFTPINKIRDAMEWSEAGPRVAEMRKAVEKGYSQDEAAALSRDLSQDFARHGYYGKELNKITAFFNANVQGIEKQMRVFKEHPYRSVLRGLLYVTLPTMLLYFINDDNEKYKQMAAWRKALFYNIPLGNPKTAQHFLSLPKPYGWGFFFGALPETILDGIKNDDPKMWADIREGFVINFDVPLAPSATSPAIDILRNKSWNKTPIESMGDKNKPAYLRYNERSSAAGKGIANVLKDVPGLNKVSPKQIDYAVKGYTGSVGDFFWRLPDTVKKGVELPTDYTNYPVVKAFITDTAYSNRTIDDFYTYGEELNMRLKEAKETGTYRAISHLPEDKQKGLVPAIKNATKEYNSLAGSFSDGRKKIREIKANDKYAPSEKKLREREVQLKMIDIANKFNKKYEVFKKKNNIK